MNFDPLTFSEATITDSNATSYDPIPVGYYPAHIENQEIKTGTKTDQDTGEIKPWARLVVTWNIEAPEIAEQLSKKKLLCRQSFFLKLNDQNTLATGKGINIDLGQLREAVGLNKKGEAFSFPMLVGRHAQVKVAHRTFDGKLIDEVVAVTALPGSNLSDFS